MTLHLRPWRMVALCIHLVGIGVFTMVLAGGKGGGPMVVLLIGSVLSAFGILAQAVYESKSRSGDGG